MSIAPDWHALMSRIRVAKGTKPGDTGGMGQTTLSPRAWGELFCLGLIWGGSFLAIRTALDEIGPLTSVLWRTTLAGALLWAVLILRRLPLAPPRLWFPLLIMGLLNNVIPFSLMAWGQLHIPSGLTSILNASTAIFGICLAGIMFSDEKLGPRKVIGVTIGFTGVVLTIGPGALWALDISSLAQLAVIAGAFSYACAGIWARSRLGSLPPISSAAGMLIGASLIIAPLALFVEGMPVLRLTLPTWGGIFYYAVIATALAYLLYYRVLAMAGAGNLMLVTLIIPPIAIGLGAYWRDEQLAGTSWAGFGFLALGLIVIDGRLAAILQKYVRSR